MKISECLRQTADRLERTGWTQQGWSEDPNKATCVVLALAGKQSARHAHPAVKFLMNYLGLKRTDTEYYPMFRWNDDPQRTKDEVLTTLREAAKAAEAEGK